MFLLHSRSKFCFLETKIDAGNNASRVAKLENMRKHARAVNVFWKHVSSFCQAFRDTRSTLMPFVFSS